MAFEKGNCNRSLTEEDIGVFRPSTEEGKYCLIFDAGSWLSDGIIEVPFVKKVRVDWMD